MAELTRLRNQTTVNNTVVTFSPFSPISPFSPRGPGKPYKNKMDIYRSTFLHMHIKVSNTLGKYTKRWFTTCFVCICALCVDTGRHTRAWGK